MVTMLGFKPIQLDHLRHAKFSPKFLGNRRWEVPLHFNRRFPNPASKFGLTKIDERIDPSVDDVAAPDKQMDLMAFLAADDPPM